jgi:hypothetical protein
MTQLNQLAGTHLLDIAVHNYGGSQLNAGVAVILDTSNPPAANSAPGVTLPASDAAPFGVLIDNIPAGRSGKCRVYGVAVVNTTGTVHVGNTLMTTSTGSVVAQTTGLNQLGYCLSEGVTGDQVLILLDRSKNS